MIANMGRWWNGILAFKASKTGSTLGVSRLASKASDMGSSPIWYPFCSVYFHFIPQSSAHNLFLRRNQRDRFSVMNEAGIY
jgi:hypothetical protein